MVINLTKGSILDDRYEILELVGEGGMGSVFKAREVELERLVAIKVLEAELLSPETVARFDREARIISRLSHANIVTFYRFGMVHGQPPYLVMEYVEGPSLREKLNECTRIGWQEVVELAIQLCRAVDYAHRCGVVHRDLKPSNILFCSESGLIKVVDFGLATLAQGASGAQSLTQTGALVGSVNYMSPEQCRGQRADERSDVYAVGCVIYECLCGCPPFEADGSLGVLFKHVRESPEPLSHRLPDEDVPSVLEKVVLHALEKDPDRRYQCAAALEEALKLIRSGNYADAGPQSRPSGLRGRLPAIWLCGAGLLMTAVAVPMLRDSTSSRFPVTQSFKDSTGIVFPLSEHLELEWLYTRILKSEDRNEYLKRWLEINAASADPFELAAARMELVQQKVCYHPDAIAFCPLDKTERPILDETQVRAALTILNQEVTPERSRQWHKNRGLLCFWKGLLLEHSRRPLEAKSEFLKAIAARDSLPWTFPRWYLWAHLAHAEAALGRKEPARCAWEEAVRRSDSHMDLGVVSRSLFAQYLTEIGELRRAREMLTEALNAVDRTKRPLEYQAPILKNLLSTAVLAGDPMLAQRTALACQRAAFRQDDFPASMQFFRDDCTYLLAAKEIGALFRKGEEAIRYAITRSDAGEESMTVARIVVPGLLGDGRTVDAEKIMSLCPVPKKPSAVRAEEMLLRGMITNARRDHLGALRECTELLDWISRNHLNCPEIAANAMAEAAVAAECLDRTESARSYLSLLRQQVRKQNGAPGVARIYVEALVRFATYLDKKGCLSESEAVIVEGVAFSERHPTSVVGRARQQLLRLRTEHLLKQGDFGAALAAAEQAVLEAKNPEDRALSLLEKGRVLSRSGNRLTAQHTLGQALDLLTLLPERRKEQLDAKHLLLENGPERTGH